MNSSAASASSESYHTPSLSCGTGCGHARLPQPKKGQLFLYQIWELCEADFLIFDGDYSRTRKKKGTDGNERNVAKSKLRPCFLIFSHKSCRLVIDKVGKDDAGMYCCRATNDVNVVFSTKRSTKYCVWFSTPSAARILAYTHVQ